MQEKSLTQSPPTRFRFAKGSAAALTGGKRSNTIHRKDAGVRKQHANNNVYERFNGTVKDRMRRVRGFPSELPALHMLFLAYHNLFRSSLAWMERPPPRWPA